MIHVGTLTTPRAVVDELRERLDVALELSPRDDTANLPTVKELLTSCSYRRYMLANEPSTAARSAGHTPRLRSILGVASRPNGNPPLL